MPERARKVATVQDVARETGLSPSSVSAVLSGRHVKRRISASTVERVLAVAKKLNYVPNVTARSLRAKASGVRHLVLTVMTSYEVPVFLVAQALHALELAIQKRGEPSVVYTVNVEMFHAGRLSEVPGLRNGQRCNGAIITNTIDLDDQFLASSRLPFPVVMLGRRIAGYPSVSVKSDMLGRKAAEILLGIGRRHLAILQPLMLTQATRSRLAAFVTATEQTAGSSPMIITADRLEERAGYEAMKRFLALRPKCDGLFAISDGLAIGAYHAIRQAKRRIPQDIAVVGVGDNPASLYIDPPLTCFESAEEEQHQAAADLLLSLVNGVTPKHLHLELSTSPLLRESTGHSASP
jgi:DNA-binding LacI/PurR family transcriptional regulator